MLANHALNIYGNALEGLITFRYACILNRHYSFSQTITYTPVFNILILHLYFFYFL